MICERNVIVIFLYLLSIITGSYTSEFFTGLNDTRSALYRLRRQTDCDGFKCKSGECIDEDFYCDGTIHCSDKSDETNLCNTIRCPGSLFRCKYGACISKLKECDGKTDCRDGSDESSLKCDKNSNKCKSDQFRCKSGQCISEDNKCDGTPDCMDQSDETLETCSKIRCPGHTAKCNYGACISKKAFCNGISDCIDNSDEDPEVCRDLGVLPNPTPKPPTSSSTKPPVIKPRPKPPVVTSPGSCVLPSQLENGKWVIYGNPDAGYEAGDRVEAETLLEIQCRKGFVPDGSALILYCIGGKWSPSVPQCLQSCPPLETTSTTFVQCSYKGSSIDCGAAVSHTTAVYSCAPYHELSTTSHVLYCLEGSWDNTKPVCRPVCGQKSVKIKELVIGGNNVTRGNYPWTIALYKKNDNGFALICGGTLISARVIVTAAHCVTDRDGNRRKENSYVVAAGKYFLKYDHSDDTDAEFSELEKIFTPDYYKGSTLDYEADIAVLVTKEAFNNTANIQRVCVDWDQNSHYESRLLGTNGTVTGWGFTIRGDKQAEILKEISLPYVDYSQCARDMPTDYRKYLRRDKMCAGYLNRGIGVCEGDSGGGLVFQDIESSRYFLRGIVSVAPQISGSCDENQYAIYTKVASYIDFLAQIERRYRSG